MKLTEERCKVYSIYEASKPLHLENGITSKSERKEGIMNITLLAYIRNWLETTKKLEVKAATYDRLNISIAALEKYSIADIPLAELTTDNRGLPGICQRTCRRWLFSYNRKKTDAHCQRTCAICI